MVRSGKERLLSPIFFLKTTRSTRRGVRRERFDVGFENKFENKEKRSGQWTILQRGTFFLTFLPLQFLFLSKTKHKRGERVLGERDVFIRKLMRSMP